MNPNKMVMPECYQEPSLVLRHHNLFLELFVKISFGIGISTKLLIGRLFEVKSLKKSTIIPFY